MDLMKDKKRPRGKEIPKQICKGTADGSRGRKLCKSRATKGAPPLVVTGIRGEGIKSLRLWTKEELCARSGGRSILLKQRLSKQRGNLSRQGVVHEGVPYPHIGRHK